MTRIFIIGAGIAGLAAANHLQQQGLKPTILEARDRCGGRIWMDSSWGIPLARGAHWIHGVIGNPMMELAQQFSTQLIKINFEKLIAFATNGQMISQEMFMQFNQEFDRAIEEARNFALHAEKDCDLALALKPFLSCQVKNPYRNALLEHKLKFFENYMGANAEYLSARHWDMGQTLSDGDCIVLDAYASIIKGLASVCDIKLNTVVKQINYATPEIEIVTEKETYYADRVIVTLPLGVLKSHAVSFNPLLSAAKQKAIAHLGMGLFNIIALQFPQPFWPVDCSLVLIANGDKRLSSDVFVNLQPLLHQPIVYCYVGGDTARALEKLSDQTVAAHMMQTLCSAFGNSIPQPTRYYMTRWGQDPFSQGAYSYIAVGSVKEDFIALAEPVDKRLFFAGEATHAHLYDATTHGAYLSGIYAAKQMLACV